MGGTEYQVMQKTHKMLTFQIYVFFWNCYFSNRVDILTRYSSYP